MEAGGKPGDIGEADKLLDAYDMPRPVHVVRNRLDVDATGLGLVSMTGSEACVCS